MGVRFGMVSDRVVVVDVGFFFFLVAVADIGGRWFILWGWSVVMGCGG